MLYLLGLMALAASPVVAGEVVHELSPEAKTAAIEAASRAPERDPLMIGQAPGAVVRDNAVHGEIGFGIGTGGTRSVFGSIYTPIGESGAAAFSFSTGRFPYQYGDPYGGRYGPWSSQAWPSL